MRRTWRTTTWWRALPRRFAYRWTFCYGRDRPYIRNSRTSSPRLPRQLFVSGRFWRAAASGRIDPAAKGALHLMTKALTARHPASLRRVPDRLHLLIGQTWAEQFTICSPARGRGRPQRSVGRMLTKQGIFAAHAVVPVARPRVVFRPGNQLRADRIGFHIAMADEHIALAVEDGRFIPPLPQRPLAAVLPVDMRDIAPPKRLHETRDRVGPAGGDHEM